MPVNTSGGQLSEAYYMGLTPIAEAAMQLMGRYAAANHELIHQHLLGALGAQATATVAEAADRRLTDTFPKWFMGSPFNKCPTGDVAVEFSDDGWSSSSTIGTYAAGAGACTWQLPNLDEAACVCPSCVLAP